MSAAYMYQLETVDYHTAGEPFRIVTAGGPDIPGATVVQRRESARRPSIDVLRRLLCHEPRGHAGMYGCFLVPPDDSGAHLGVLFWHNDGFSTACGHGTIALGVWAVESGQVPANPDGDTDVVIDVPSGRATARVSCRGGVVQSVVFENVPAYVTARGVSVRTSLGVAVTDVSYGGALYASVPAGAFGLSVRDGELSELVRVGREVKHALDGTEASAHPSDARLGGIYGVILYEEVAEGDRVEGGPHQRNITVFADGQVDRSPCGSGTSARLALLAEDGHLDAGKVLTHDSVVGTRFTGRVVRQVSLPDIAGMHDQHDRRAVVTEVRGHAFRTGEHRFLLDAQDYLGEGFRL